MSFASSVPWGLLLPAATLVTLSFTSGGDGPPDPAESSAYTWTTLHRHGGELRGPSGIGVVLGDVVQRGKTVIAVAPDQSFRSADGGETWKEIPELRRPFGVSFASNGVVVVGRFNGELSRSVNDGETWTDVKTDGEGATLSLAFAGDTGFATAYGSLLHTADGGQTWRRGSMQVLLWNHVAAVERTAIAVAGAGLVARSVDGGETWQTRWLPDEHALNGVAFADERTVVIVGSDGAILRSTDAGLSWTAVPSPARTHLRAVAFASATEGLAVGYWGEAVRTSDGGATWARERTGTRMHLMGVSARPGGGFLLSGTRETVLAAMPGGAQ